MEPKKRKRRTRYTLMIFSDSMEDGVKQVYLGSKRWKALKTLLCIVLIADICYCVYNPILLSGVRDINSIQKSQIEELIAEKESLEAENKALTDKVAILSETVNQKVKAEEEQAAELAESSMPTGFPLTGAASIKDPQTEETQTDEEDTENAEAEESETKKAQEPILVFEGTEGNMVVASGGGTVIAVGADETYGNRIVVEHGNGYQSIYRNKGEARVKQGDEVVRGTTLFILDEGNLEFGYQITQDGNYINPEEVVEISG